jgi:hypothetical protein
LTIALEMITHHSPAYAVPVSERLSSERPWLSLAYLETMVYDSIVARVLADPDFDPERFPNTADVVSEALDDVIER